MVDALDSMRLAAAGGIPADAPLRAPSSGGDNGFGILFSKHAAKRIEQRGLDLGDDRMARLDKAMGQAQAKGSKDSLILLDDLALVVSVQNRTVVTAMDEESSKEHVFTNIDSVVIAPK